MITAQAYEAAERRCDEDPLGRRLLEVLPPQGFHLEAGCGPGYWIAALRSHGLNLVGIENASKVVHQARKVRPDLPLLIADVRHLPFPEGSFDSVISLGVVEHDPQGPQDFLREFYRVLRSDGALVLSVPYFGPLRKLKATFGCFSSLPPEGTEFYQYGYSHRELATRLDENGFQSHGRLYYGAHRLWQEEIPLYRRTRSLRGYRLLKAMVERWVSPFDGHMIVLFARKRFSNAS